MPTVWTLRVYADQDMATAEAVGSVRLLVDRLDVHHVDTLVADLSIALRQFWPEDWLVKAGDPLAFGLCLWLLHRAGHQKLNLLSWDRRLRSYERRVLDFGLIERVVDNVP